MTVSFKKFVELVDQEEISEEQINELFGMFATDNAATKAKRAEDFKARREAIKQKQAALKAKKPNRPQQAKKNDSDEEDVELDDETK
jgi:hypothetical protein